MKLIIHAVDAPGATCDDGELSEPTSVSLRMVDDDGDVLEDTSKTIVCAGGGKTTNLKTDVFFQSPLNCAGSEVPPSGNPGSSNGVITTTASGSPGTAIVVESTGIKCFE